MDISEIERLLSILQDSRISELEVSVGDAKVRLRKPAAPSVARTPPAPTETAEPASESEPAEEPTPTEIYIVAPMVGMFHSIDAISAVGAAVKVGQVVGVIESMKLMNDVMSEHDGVIAEILIEDGMAVEYGQNLFRLEEASGHAGGDEDAAE